jgi:hypothetical protein
MGRCARTSGILSTVTKKIFYYHKGTGHNTSCWDLSMKSLTNHFLKQFNEKCYNVIQAFQRERNIKVAIHVRDLNAQGDGILCTSKQITRGTLSYAIILFLHAKVVGKR